MVGWVALAYSLLAVALGVGFYLAWTLGREWLVATVVALIMFGGMAVWSQGQGLPKPCTWEIWQQRQVAVIAATWEEDRAIWVWVALDRPFYCEFPWNEGKARKLAQGLELQREDEARLFLDMKRFAGDFSVHIRPPEPLPDKDEQ